MSHVDNFILTFSVLDDDLNHVSRINLTEIEGFNGFEHVEYNLGPKVLEACIYIAATNYVDWDALLGAIVSQPWSVPSHVKLWVCRQDDEHFEQLDLDDMIELQDQIRHNP